MKWSSDGCAVASYTLNTTTCLCNHLTEFVSFSLKEFFPIPNIPRIGDVQITAKTLLAFLTIIGILIVGLILFIMGCFHDRRHRIRFLRKHHPALPTSFGHKFQYFFLQIEGESKPSATTNTNGNGSRFLISMNLLFIPIPTALGNCWYWLFTSSTSLKEPNLFQGI